MFGIFPAWWNIYLLIFYFNRANIPIFLLRRKKYWYPWAWERICWILPTSPSIQLMSLHVLHVPQHVRPKSGLQRSIFDNFPFEAKHIVFVPGPCKYYRDPQARNRIYWILSAICNMFHSMFGPSPACSETFSIFFRLRQKILYLFQAHANIIEIPGRGTESIGFWLPCATCYTTCSAEVWL